MGKKPDKEETHRPNGCFKPGNPYSWGPDNPPPKSPGRPKKDAWVKALEEELRGNTDEGIPLPVALARRIIQIALTGRNQDSLRALQEIQDRVGGKAPMALVSGEGGEGVRIVFELPKQSDDDPRDVEIEQGGD